MKARYSLKAGCSTATSAANAVNRWEFPPKARTTPTNSNEDKVKKKVFSY